MDDNFDDYFESDLEEQPRPTAQETETEREDREIKEATIERRGYSLKLLLALMILAMAIFLGWWI